MNMTSNKPYLIRAFYDWIVDNQLTPYLLVNATLPGVQVPQEHVHQGRIVLNISPTATRGLLLENDRVVFTARFSGQAQQISFSPSAVLEMYAKENGKGISFPAEETEAQAPVISATTPVTNTVKNKPALTLVKKD